MILALLNPMKIIVSSCSYNWDGCIQCLLTRNSLETARNQVISASISWLDRVTSNECHIYGSRFFCDWWKTLYAFGFILYERLFVKGRQMSFHFFFGLIPLQQHEIKEIRPKRINKYIFFSQKENTYPSFHVGQKTIEPVRRAMHIRDEWPLVPMINDCCLRPTKHSRSPSTIAFRSTGFICLCPATSINETGQRKEKEKTLKDLKNG